MIVTWASGRSARSGTLPPPAPPADTAEGAGTAQAITGKVVDIGVAAGVEARQAPAIPVRIAATELLGLQLRGTLDEVITADHDQRVGREWRSTDARHTVSHAVSIASVTDSQGMARRGRRLTSERKP